jgi:protein TonB
MTMLRRRADSIAVVRRVLFAGSFATVALVVAACATLDGPTAPAPADLASTALQGTLCAAEPVFTPYERAPEVLNVEEVRQALVREYPPVIRNAGIGGRTIMWICVTEMGDVANVLVNQPSGVPQLDEAALRVARVFEFTAAINQDRNVAVWISIPMTFQTTQ